jgi:hypothetical protein
VAALIRWFAPAECQLPVLVLMSAYGPFGVADSILDALDGLSLVGLTRLGEFPNALIVNLRNLRKPLGIA